MIETDVPLVERACASLPQLARRRRGRAGRREVAARRTREERPHRTGPLPVVHRVFDPILVHLRGAARRQLAVPRVPRPDETGGQGLQSVLEVR
jgi:hypothetical protein